MELLKTTYLKYIIVAGIIFIFFSLNNFEIKGIYSCTQEKFADVSSAHTTVINEYKDFKFTWHEGFLVHKVIISDGLLKGTFKVLGNKNNFKSIVFLGLPSSLINYNDGNLFYIHSNQVAAQALLASCKEQIGTEEVNNG